MSWANVVLVAIGGALAALGGLHNLPALVGLGSTIVGGVLGHAVPARQAKDDKGAPGTYRQRRRRQPAAPPPHDETIRSRLPRMGGQGDGAGVIGQD